MEEKTIRIQKYFSDQGIASRRKTEEWIKQGYVLLNGQKVTEPGVRFDPNKDKVTLDPKVQEAQNYLYFIFHKPKGIVTVNAQKGEQEIKDIIKLPKGVVPVGRLDKDSMGLIFLTNDGVVARRIMEPKFEHEKEYEVSFFKQITEEAIKKLSQGLFLEGEKTKPVLIKRQGAYRISMVLKEGKNRQIRKMCKQVGFEIKKLIRLRVLNFYLGDLPPGKIKQLSKEEIKKLYKELNINRKST
ncbi:MAG: rRNA pseudouridine synthase [Candidatus Margulisbacteria bacterium]|nr:rRNA pseudouridine synthase [Candidatus Margulisiibacteriota bacterium]